MATTATTKGAAPAAAIVVPAGAPAPKFGLGARVQATAANAFGAVTGGKWQAGQWVYEIRYEKTGALSTWFESQLKPAPAEGSKPKAGAA